VVERVKECLERRTGVPRGCVRLAALSGRALDKGLVEDGTTLSVVGRLPGGKGGFGALLRSSRSGRETTNFDACRDLQGRRVGGVEAERRLEEWRGREEERELEKVAEKHLREAAKAERRKEEEKVNIQEFREELEEVGEKVADAVRDGLKQASVLAGSKRKEAIRALAAGASTSKRPKRAFGLEDFSDSESD